MNLYGNSFRRCSKCKKVIRGQSGWYIQIFNRKDRNNRENGFICNSCYIKLDKWMDKK